MKKPVIITLIVLVLALAIGVSVFAISNASAGSSGDPLVSQSYVDGEYSQALIKTASAPIDSALKSAYDEGSAALTLTAAPAASRHVVTAEGKLSLSEGASILMVSGEAKLTIAAGSVSDVTSGSAAVDGAIAANHRYVLLTGAKATIDVTEKATFVCSGAVSVTAGEVAQASFKDIKPGDWFYNDVVYTVSLGLFDGKSADVFAPNETLTLSAAIKLAACMHQQYNEGTVTLKPDEDIWYMSFVKYAMENNILEGSYASKTATDYASPITRQEFAHIFYNALPKDTYTEINVVKDNSIPDVKTSSTYGDEIYTFYRAGILVGDSKNYFNASTNIRRSEVAAITARMMDPSLRASVTLG